MKENLRASYLRRRFRSLLLTLRRRRALVHLLLVGSLLLLLFGVVVHRRPGRVRRRFRPDLCQIPLTYRDDDELQGRIHRFPSVQERVKLYMSNWYRTPCNESLVRQWNLTAVSKPIPLQKRSLSNGTIVYLVGEKEVPNDPGTRRFQIGSGTLPARMFHADLSTLRHCAADDDPHNHMRFYCKDIISTITSLLSDDQTEISFSGVPLFYQFGDATESKAPDEWGQSLLSQPRLPHVKKFRLSLHYAELEHITRQNVWTPQDRAQSCTVAVPSTVRGAQRLQPIIWKLNIKRHFGYLYQVPCNDSPWETKKNMAIFRGKLNGDLKKATSDNMLERCLALERCKLTWDYRDSKLIDARLTSMMNVLPSVVEGVDLMAPVLSMKDMLGYKGIIVLEGNDVSSGLKNAMLSSSVVLMPKPLFTSWAMEELLEPWIHYIPLLPDLSDVEDKVAWMLQHEAEAQRISYRATLWIKDLVFHPTAAQDEESIMKEILKRYSQHFVMAHAA